MNPSEEKINKTWKLLSLQNFQRKSHADKRKIIKLLYEKGLHPNQSLTTVLIYLKLIDDPKSAITSVLGSTNHPTHTTNPAELKSYLKRFLQNASPYSEGYENMEYFLRNNRINYSVDNYEFVEMLFREIKQELTDETLQNVRSYIINHKFRAARGSEDANSDRFLKFYPPNGFPPQLFYDMVQKERPDISHDLEDDISTRMADIMRHNAKPKRGHSLEAPINPWTELRHRYSTDLLPDNELGRKISYYIARHNN